MTSVTEYRITRAKEDLRAAELLAQAADCLSYVYFSCMAITVMDDFDAGRGIHKQYAAFGGTNLRRMTG